MIDSAALARARTLIARLEMISHGRALNFETGRGGGGSPFPPGGIAGKDDREPDHPLRSHLHYRRRLAGCNTSQDAEAVIADVEQTLAAWKHTPRPPADSPAWQELVAKDPRKARIVAAEWNIKKEYVWMLRRRYATNPERKSATDTQTNRVAPRWPWS